MRKRTATPEATRPRSLPPSPAGRCFGATLWPTELRLGHRSRPSLCARPGTASPPHPPRRLRLGLRADTPRTGARCFLGPVQDPRSQLGSPAVPPAAHPHPPKAEAQTRDTPATYGVGRGSLAPDSCRAQGRLSPLVNLIATLTSLARALLPLVPGQALLSEVKGEARGRCWTHRSGCPPPFLPHWKAAPGQRDGCEGKALTHTCSTVRPAATCSCTPMGGPRAVFRWPGGHGGPGTQT